VGIDGKAPLAELPVTDTIDAKVFLMLHNIADGVRKGGFKRRFVETFAVVLGYHEADEVPWTREAADMGGQNSVGAGFHIRPLHLFCFFPN
jgi:hypothetical protein